MSLGVSDRVSPNRGCVGGVSLGPSGLAFPEYPKDLRDALGTLSWTLLSDISKPMVCMRVAFHENDGNYDNDENDEDNKELSAGLAEITETVEMTKTTGIQGANHGSPNNIEQV